MKVFLETEKGSKTRTRYDERAFKPKESFEVGYPYPYDYGFIIGTNKKMNDCIDCYIISEQKLYAGSIIECEPVGMIEMMEDGEIDHKVLMMVKDEGIEDTDKIVYVVRGFITNIFNGIPGVEIKLGNLISKRETELFIQENI
jgi:inorganic pyrophosphatase